MAILTFIEISIFLKLPKISYIYLKLQTHIKFLNCKPQRVANFCFLPHCKHSSTIMLLKISFIVFQAKFNFFLFYRGAKHLERKPVTVDREQAAMATKMVNLHSDVEDLKQQEMYLDRMIEQRKLQMGIDSNTEDIKRYPLIISSCFSIKCGINKLIDSDCLCRDQDTKNTSTEKAPFHLPPLCYVPYFFKLNLHKVKNVEEEEYQANQIVTVEKCQATKTRNVFLLFAACHFLHGGDAALSKTLK